MKQNSVTFLYIDIEDSIRLWELNPQGMTSAMNCHNTVVAHAIHSYQGKIFQRMGDDVCAIFASATDALWAAFEIQHHLSQQPDLSIPLPIRIGLHSAEVEGNHDDDFGKMLNRIAQITRAASSGQILLSSATREQFADNIELRDLNMHYLPDLNEMEHLYQAIIPGIPLNLKPIRSLTSRPTNLPAQFSSFVGRNHDLTEISRLLGKPEVRLVTLVGAGGIGKSRLAIQAGASLLDSYQDGVFFLALAPLAGADDILKLLIQTFKIQEDPALDSLDLIKNYLRNRYLLLILDNFEHLIDAASVISDLLSAAEHLQIVVTSREALFIAEEQIYHVSPMEVPSQSTRLDEMLHLSAVALLIDRIKMWQPDFSLSEATAPYILRICQQLEGLPLALELAAARVRDLSIVEIAEQLDHSLSLLSQGTSELPGRQRTMHSAIEWSYLLLSPQEQRLFARLAVFEDRFTVEAAQAVAASAGLTALRNKSLLQQSPGAFFMLGVLREYALERLRESGELTRIRQKHADYYLNLLENAEPHLSGQGQIEWFNRLRIEQHNWRAALNWFVEQENWEAVGSMVGILWRYWGIESHLSEATRWFQQVLSHENALPALIHAKVTQGAGRLALIYYQYDRATILQKFSLNLYESLQDVAGQASVLLSLGETEQEQHHAAEAEQYFEDSLSLFRELDDQAGIGRNLNNLGKLAMQAGDYQKAEGLLRESLALIREYGSSEGVALALYNLANILRIQDKFTEARQFYNESLEIYGSLNFDVGAATLLNSLGYVALGEDKPYEALRFFREALKLLQTSEETVLIGECLVGFATTFLSLGNRASSLRTIAAAKTLLDALDGRLEYADQIQYDQTLAVLQTGDWQIGWEIGQALLLEEIIAEVMSYEQAASTASKLSSPHPQFCPPK